MANCKLTTSVNGTTCAYAVAGARKIYLANYFPPSAVTVATEGQIGYTFDTDGKLTDISLPPDESFYELNPSDNTLSFVDALLVGGNGGKYRQHTVNAVLNQLDIDVLNQGDALSLGRFVAVVVDAAGRIIVLGRLGGLAAPAGGFDYNSGAADADALGWTLILQGTSTEIGRLVLNAAVISPIYTAVVTP